jgi:predicted transcriptional regulator
MQKAIDGMSVCATLKHTMALKGTIHFRTTKTIKARFRRLARVARKDPSDLGREIIKDFVMRREAELRAPGAIQEPVRKALELEQHAA